MWCTTTRQKEITSGLFSVSKAPTIWPTTKLWRVMSGLFVCLLVCFFISIFCFLFLFFFCFFISCVFCVLCVLFVCFVCFVCFFCVFCVCFSKSHKTRRQHCNESIFSLVLYIFDDFCDCDLSICFLFYFKLLFFILFHFISFCFILFYFIVLFNIRFIPTATISTTPGVETH
jgi:hypothetical protein